jgi:hypothetical protein
MVSATPSMKFSSGLAVALFFHRVVCIVEIVGLVSLVVLIAISTIVDFICFVRLVGLQWQLFGILAFICLRRQRYIGV